MRRLLEAQSIPGGGESWFQPGSGRCRQRHELARRRSLGPARRLQLPGRPRCPLDCSAREAAELEDRFPAIPAALKLVALRRDPQWQLVLEQDGILSYLPSLGVRRSRCIGAAAARSWSSVTAVAINSLFAGRCWPGDVERYLRSPALHAGSRRFESCTHSGCACSTSGDATRSWPAVTVSSCRVGAA
jgi:hypothetical protein